MPRLWVLLLFLWYYAIAVARTDTGDSTQELDSRTTLEESQRSPLTFKDYELPTDILLPLKEDIYNFQPESGSFRDVIPPWDSDAAVKFSLEDKRKKRSVSSKNMDVNHESNNENAEITKREVDLPGTLADSSNDASRSEEVSSSKQLSSNGVTDSVKGDVLDLLSKYQSLIDAKINHLFYNPENGYELFQKCLQPIDNKKSFNPWGGKRVFSYDDQMYKMCLESLTSPRELFQPYFFRTRSMKMPFKPWNGKRNGDDDFSPKRLPFRAWGGKREHSEDGMAPKRIPFRAWGGKRSQEKPMNPVYPIADIGSLQNEMSSILGDNSKREHRKKTKFYSWGGKRSVDKRTVLSLPHAPTSTDLLTAGYSPKDLLYAMAPWRTYSDSVASPDIHTVANRRMKFNSWGGKRSFLGYKPDEGKRTFNAWGGKRASKTGDENEGRRRFNAWGGKRSDLDYSAFEEPEGKRTFNAWGGKRGYLEIPQFEENMIDSDNNDNLMNEAYKRTFNAWGGK